MSKANFVSIPNLTDEILNRMQAKIATAFSNLDTPVALVITTVTTDYLVSADDDVVLCDPSQAAFRVALPAIGKLTKPVSLRTIGASANTVTASAPTPTTIDGAASLTLTKAPVRLVSNAQGYWSS